MSYGRPDGANGGCLPGDGAAPYGRARGSACDPCSSASPDFSSYGMSLLPHTSYMRVQCAGGGVIVGVFRCVWDRAQYTAPG